MINYTPFQKAAIGILEWLLSDEEEYKGTGRTEVIAYAQLQWLIKNLDKRLYPKNLSIKYDFPSMQHVLIERIQQIFIDSDYKKDYDLIFNLSGKYFIMRKK